jgi:hypothetical protein
VAKNRDGVNKSEEIRRLLKANPQTSGTDAVAKLAEKGIAVKPSLFYFVKGQLKGRRARKKKVQQTIANVAESTHANRSDAVATIRKVKSWADEVGGMKTLKALIEALSE